MKYVITFCICSIIFLTHCTPNKKDSNNKSENCNTLVFEKYQQIVKVGVKYDENSTVENCNALKQAAKDYKTVMIDCGLWELENTSARDEIEEIINLDCS